MRHNLHGISSLCHMVPVAPATGRGLALNEQKAARRQRPPRRRSDTIRLSHALPSLRRFAQRGGYKGLRRLPKSSVRSNAPRLAHSSYILPDRGSAIWGTDARGSRHVPSRKGMVSSHQAQCTLWENRLRPLRLAEWGRRRHRRKRLVQQRTKSIGGVAMKSLFHQTGDGSHSPSGLATGERTVATYTMEGE